MATKVRVEDIAKEVGVTPREIRTRLRSLGFRKKGSRWEWDKDSREFQNVMLFMREEAPSALWMNDLPEEAWEMILTDGNPFPSLEEAMAQAKTWLENVNRNNDLMNDDTMKSMVSEVERFIIKHG